MNDGGYLYLIFEIIWASGDAEENGSNYNFPLGELKITKNIFTMESNSA